ncbi:D-cysteine desulfhydrase [Marinomonas ushuaiensis DSM 15871]|uniref:D-cysteine desulfhydrase n=1 Tax=Marinomonas ushuaiensis DSM 15871 TaxID=1122207 RepID=X7E914_9GAMM|nr:cysteine desulfhydrase [Marinomonas ushuaiensis]ETX11696.1 D-cysteine desulfhydrase [Marinomonas ushuaiensis DSM 15871]
MSLIFPLTLPFLVKNPSQPKYEMDVYRGDLEYPKAPGNKWHKLQHHLIEAQRQNANVIATFGGPFSNHLHAFGATLAQTSFKAVAIVRGELQPKLTPTLLDMVADGVELWPSSRSDYRLGEQSDVAKVINHKYKNVYWVPEGGGGELGALGCRDWAAKICEAYGQYDAWVVSAGTGTTAAGFLANETTPTLHVFSALKGASDQRNEIVEQAHKMAEVDLNSSLSDRLFFHSDCHEGGYAKHTPALLAFLKSFAAENPAIPLDPVYTSKSMFAVLSLMEQGAWPYRRTLFIHTGGLQGWRGYSSASNPFLALERDGES